MPDQIGYFASLKNSLGKIFSYSASITLAGTDGKTITCTQDTSLDEAVAMSSKAPKVSPSLTTPTLGVATATSINSVYMGILGLTNVAAGATKTVTVTVGNTWAAMFLMFGAYDTGGGAYGTMDIIAGGQFSGTSIYNVTGTIVNNGSVVFAGLTKAANYFTFTIQNTGGNIDQFSGVWTSNQPITISVA